MKDNLGAFWILELQTSHPKELTFFSNSGICYYRKIRVSLCRQHFSFCLGEYRIYFYSANSNILASRGEVQFFFLWFLPGMQWILLFSILKSVWLRSYFLYNICLWLLLHLQLFLFSTLEHLKSLDFISILCFVEPHSPSFYLPILFSVFCKRSTVCSMDH